MHATIILSCAWLKVTSVILFVARLRRIILLRSISHKNKGQKICPLLLEKVENDPQADKISVCGNEEKAQKTAGILLPYLC